MSDALRALNDGEAQFDAPPGGMPGEEGVETPSSSEPQSHTGYEKPAAAEPAEPDGDTGELKEHKGEKLSKFELAKQKKERDRAKEENRWTKHQEKLAEESRARQAAEQRAAQAEANARQAQEQARINANPLLREAYSLLQQRQTPEQVEKEAQAYRDIGDEQSAKAGFEIARLMRLEIEDQKRAQETETQRAVEGQWKQAPYGTPEFDASAMKLKAGTPDFNECWALAERNILSAQEVSQDPFDRQCAKEFRDINSPFGQRLMYFFKQTAFGRELGKSALGMIPGYDVVKAYYRIDVQNAELAKLRAETQRLRGFTSIGPGAPTDSDGNGSSSRYNGDATRNREDGRAFASMSLDEQRAWLRSRESQ